MVGAAGDSNSFKHVHVTCKNEDPMKNKGNVRSPESEQVLKIVEGDTCTIKNEGARVFTLYIDFSNAQGQVTP